jgi:penicillin-binding protein 1B
MTPIDVAAAYTPFASNGFRAEPLFLRSVLAADGTIEETVGPRTRAVLDPRVAFLTTSIMEEVINRGTGVTVRSMGFTPVAAGKTGTSRDGWFAGFTSNLLCVVWIGFDDNRDLGLSGSASAAPVWAEFMKRATALPQYKMTADFDPPPGVIAEMIDPKTGELANSSCPQYVQEYFIAGSEPTEVCGQQASSPSNWLSHLFGKGSNPPPPPSVTANPPGQPPQAGAKPAAPGDAQAPPPANGDTEKKKGLLDKIFGIFGSSKKPAESQKPQP